MSEYCPEGWALSMRNETIVRERVADEIAAPGVLLGPHYFIAPHRFGFSLCRYDAGVETVLGEFAQVADAYAACPADPPYETEGWVR